MTAIAILAAGGGPLAAAPFSAGLPSELRQGRDLARALSSGQKSCADLTNPDFERIGEYAMGSALASPARSGPAPGFPAHAGGPAMMGGEPAGQPGPMMVRDDFHHHDDSSALLAAGVGLVGALIGGGAVYLFARRRLGAPDG